MAISVETFFLAADGQGTLQAQIQQMIAQGILSGRFHRGEKLPSSRSLAAHLGVSRITVTLAYTELLANDYLSSRGRSGYFVSDNAPVPPVYDPRPASEDRVDWTRAITRTFTGGDTPVKPSDWENYRYPFIYGQVDPTLFDHANWRLSAMRALGAKDFSSLTSDYYDRDDLLLVEFISRHTLPRRGITARPSEVLITMGAQNALWLTAQVLLNSRRRAAIEDPGYHALRDVLAHTRCSISPVRVDADGLPPDAIPADTDIIFSTPSHQSPTTATMPMARRKALLEKASALNALIIEDDYEFELSFLGAPSPALKSMDRDGRVIYVGSFSKSLFPGLRLGYLVGSEPFIREARALRASVLRHPPGHVQRTAAYFLSLGHYDAQIRRLRRHLAGRRRALQTALESHRLFTQSASHFGGTSFWVRGPEWLDSRLMAEHAAAEGVLIEAGDVFYGPVEPPLNFFRLAYSSIPEGRIAEGVARLAAVVEKLRRMAELGRGPTGD